MTEQIKKLVDESKEQLELLPLCKIYSANGYGSVTITFVNGEIVGIDPQIKFKYDRDYNVAQDFSKSIKTASVILDSSKRTNAVPMDGTTNG